MEIQPKCRKVARLGHSWAYRILVQPQLVVVPLQSRADRPLAEADQVLNVDRLFKIRTAAGKRKGCRAGVEDAQIDRALRVCKIGAVGRHTAGVFVQENRIGFDSRLPLGPSVMDGDASVEVDFLEVIVLSCNKRPGRRIRIKIIGVVGGHESQPANRIGGKNMLRGGAPHGFEVVARPQLPSRCEHAVAWLVPRRNRRADGPLLDNSVQGDIGCGISCANSNVSLTLIAQLEITQPRAIVGSGAAESHSYIASRVS